ncbi:MAG: universal stress protein [Aquificaceae bacterium]|nr:universal stress protein [Aquificaceae bacterium]
MLGRVAVQISEEDPEYLSYAKAITSKLGLSPHFLYVKREHPIERFCQTFQKSSEEKQNAIKRAVHSIFGDLHFLTLYGDGEKVLTDIKENYDLLFLKYNRRVLGESIPEWLVSETDELRFWVYKDGAKVDIKKACLPVDFSERSLKQVEFADTLRNFFDFEFQLVHSVNVGRLKGKLSGKDYKKSLLDKEEETKHMYTDLFGDRELNLVLLEGDPYRELVKYINTWDYDLVIVGRRGRGMKEQIGSVSLHLMRRLKCPVVVL